MAGTYYTAYLISLFFTSSFIIFCVEGDTTFLHYSWPQPFFFDAPVLCFWCCLSIFFWVCCIVFDLLFFYVCLIWYGIPGHSPDDQTFLFAAFVCSLKLAPFQFFPFEHCSLDVVQGHQINVPFQTKWQTMIRKYDSPT